MDSDGQLHDLREVYFDMGVFKGQINGLSPKSTTFCPGDQGNFTGQVENTGNLPLDAQLVLVVTAVEGDYQVSQVQDLSGIPSG